TPAGRGAPAAGPAALPAPASCQPPRWPSVAPQWLLAAARPSPPDPAATPQPSAPPPPPADLPAAGPRPPHGAHATTILSPSPRARCTCPRPRSSDVAPASARRKPGADLL